MFERLTPCTSELGNSIPGPRFPLVCISLHPKGFVMLFFTQLNPPRGKSQFIPGVELQGPKDRDKASDHLRSEPQRASNTPVTIKPLADRRKGVSPQEHIREGQREATSPFPIPYLPPPEKKTSLQQPRQKEIKFSHLQSQHFRTHNLNSVSPSMYICCPEATNTKEIINSVGTLAKSSLPGPNQISH